VLGGNVASHGQSRVDPSIARRRIETHELAEFVEPPTAVVSHSKHRLAAEVRRRLDAETLQMVRGSCEADWAPFVVQLGIGREERYFWRTAETMQIVSLALPHLSRRVRVEAIAYLDRLWRERCPLTVGVHPADGIRREPYELGPKMKEFASRTPRYEPQISDLYSVWAYAHYADRWPRVLGQRARIAELFDGFVSKPPRFDSDDIESDSSQHLNAHVGGVLAALRVFEHTNDAKHADTARRLLADLVAVRVHHERSDHRLVRPTKGESRGIHQAKLPRYVDLAPELSRMLARFAGDALAIHLTDLRQALPIWHHAYGERLIGGENYISPPHLSRSIFMIWSDGGEAPPAALASHLDQPWCSADLHYIEKLSAILRRFE
jgi:hypothetical protein